MECNFCDEFAKHICYLCHKELCEDCSVKKFGIFCEWCSETICERCGENGDFTNSKFCTECENTLCTNCVGVTACQTAECICKNCFDYRCEECKEKIERIDCSYIWDGDPLPVCKKCVKMMHVLKHI